MSCISLYVYCAVVVYFSVYWYDVANYLSFVKFVSHLVPKGVLVIQLTLQRVATHEMVVGHKLS